MSNIRYGTYLGIAGLLSFGLPGAGGGGLGRPGGGAGLPKLVETGRPLVGGLQ